MGLQARVALLDQGQIVDADTKLKASLGVVRVCMECVCDCGVRTYVWNMVELLVRNTGFGLYCIVSNIAQSNLLSEFLEGYTKSVLLIGGTHYQYWLA